MQVTDEEERAAGSKRVWQILYTLHYWGYQRPAQADMQAPSKATIITLNTDASC